MDAARALAQVVAAVRLATPLLQPAGPMALAVVRAPAQAAMTGIPELVATDGILPRDLSWYRRSASHSLWWPVSMGTQTA